MDSNRFGSSFIYNISLFVIWKSRKKITKLPAQFYLLHIIINISNVRIVITSSCGTFSYRGNNPLCLSTSFVLNIYSNQYLITERLKQTITIMRNECIAGIEVYCMHVVKLMGYHLFIIFICSLFESLEFITKLPELAFITQYYKYFKCCQQHLF